MGLQRDWPILGLITIGGNVAEEKENLFPAIYEIKLEGHLNDSWVDWFYDLAITHECDAPPR